MSRWSDFNAAKRGVSRRHMAIRRKGSLIYIVDVGSTNGTYLNGRRLQRNEERILRDGDEIHLSHLFYSGQHPEASGSRRIAALHRTQNQFRTKTPGLSQAGVSFS